MFEHLKNKKLYRSPKDGLVFGVGSGLAHYLQVDVIFIRLLMAAVAFFSGWWPMVLAYIVGVVLMPIDPAQDTVARDQEPKDVTPEPVENMDRGQNM